MSELRDAIVRQHDLVCACPFDGTDDGCNLTVSGAWLGAALAAEVQAQVDWLHDDLEELARHIAKDWNGRPGPLAPPPLDESHDARYRDGYERFRADLVALGVQPQVPAQEEALDWERVWAVVMQHVGIVYTHQHAQPETCGEALAREYAAHTAEFPALGGDPGA